MRLCSALVNNSANVDSMGISGGDFSQFGQRVQRDYLCIFGLNSKQLLEDADLFVIDGDTMPEEICPVVGPADNDGNKLFVCRRPD